MQRYLTLSKFTRSIYQKLGVAVDKWLFLSVMVGIVSGLASILIYYLFQIAIDLIFYGILGSTVESGSVWIEVIVFITLPATGGLLAGIIGQWVREVKENGINEYVRAFHKEGKVRSAVIPTKTLASIFTISSGGSAGVEGVLVHVGAGLGSLVASLFRVDDIATKRMLLIAGAGGGIAAISRAPLASALFVTETLYRRDIEVRAVIPTMVSSIVSYTMFYSVYGLGPLLEAPAYHFGGASELIAFGVLAVFVWFVSVVYIWVYRKAGLFFEGKNFIPFLSPVMGGVVVGVTALVVNIYTGRGMDVMGLGYATVSNLFTSPPVLGVITIILIGKIVTTSFTLRSGGSGGLFAPSIIIGALSGAVFWSLMEHVGFLTIPIQACVLVGMASMLTCTFRVPLTSLIIVPELTGSYTLLPGLMVAITVANILSKDDSIVLSQVKSRIYSSAHTHEMAYALLSYIKVGSAMSSNVDTVRLGTTVQGVLDKVWMSGHTSFPVLNSSGELVGIITFQELGAVPPNERGKYIDDMVREVPTIVPDESLTTAFQMMRNHEIQILPVVSPDDNKKVIGVITEKDMITVYAKISEI